MNKFTEKSRSLNYWGLNRVIISMCVITIVALNMDFIVDGVMGVVYGY